MHAVHAEAPSLPELQLQMPREGGAVAGANALASAICSCPRLGKLNLSNLSQRVLDPKGPSALKLTAAVAQHRIAFPEALTKLTLTLL